MIPIKIEKTRPKPFSDDEKKIRRSRLAKKTALILIVLAVFILGGTLFFVKRSSSSSTLTRQAIFVTTGQVYFGYVSNENSPMVRVDQAYYLNGASALMPNQQQSQEKIALIRVGSEIYKPMSSVLINRDQIIAIQDISADSQINTAIQNSLKSN